jgi:hypothetical protein
MVFSAAGMQLDATRITSNLENHDCAIADGSLLPAGHDLLHPSPLDHKLSSATDHSQNQQHGCDDGIVWVQQ